MAVKDKVTKDDVLKWLVKLEPLVEMAEPVDDKAEQLLENARAYVKDARHWLKQDNLVLAFECMVWAYCIFDVCKKLDIISLPTRRP